ncbi:MAG: glycine--tRNA ligase [Candidatus Marsarchaeota archaeon]|nr:glycine--tRNA ligase [Candidatus Marsarchaeota archaeon]
MDFMEKKTDKILNLAIRRGIILPSFEIYGELSGFYDYGPIGARIKQRIASQWRKFFIEDIGNLEIETTIIAPEKVFEASGHLKTFTDPIISCAECKTSYRADKLLEEFFEHKNDLETRQKIKQLSFNEMFELIKINKLKCQKCSHDLSLSKVETFNLMLGTNVGPLNGIKAYMRPETAQGIFLDFKTIFRAYGLKLPIGIGQIGKAFRNEISPRNILIRMREFSQMELEYFFDPEDTELKINNNIIDTAFLNQKINLLTVDDQTKTQTIEYNEITIQDALNNKIIPNKLFAFIIYKEMEFMLNLGFKQNNFRFRQMLPNELPHYSKTNIDLEVEIDGNFEEVAGNSYRTDFDLKNHEKYSNLDMSIVNSNKKLVPHVVEISFGLDRLFWSILVNSLYKDKREWDILILNKNISPYIYAVFPLQKDDKILKKSNQIISLLSKNNISSYFSASNSIGKRYAKADEIGINYSITIDFQTLQDNTVTIRDIKDSTQVRKNINELIQYITDN